MRYRVTTVLLKARRGSEQYQSMNSRMAWSYDRWELWDVRLFRTADFDCSRSGSFKTVLGFRLRLFLAIPGFCRTARPMAFRAMLGRLSFLLHAIAQNCSHISRFARHSSKLTRLIAKRPVNASQKIDALDIDDPNGWQRSPRRVGVRPQPILRGDAWSNKVCRSQVHFKDG